MTILLSEYKDILGQNIKEGDLCLFVKDKHTIQFGVVLEVRKKVKVGYTYEGKKWVAGNVWTSVGIQVAHDWVSEAAVTIVEEDWLYDRLPADILHSMATIRSEKKAEIEKILAAKERKKIREEGKKL